jgi:general secretion pathway protein A
MNSVSGEKEFWDSMYIQHFGLNVQPFEDLHNPAFFFNQGDYARIRKGIRDSLSTNPGLTIVTGVKGAGKSTLSQMVISDFFEEMEIIWMAEPPKYGKDLFLFIARQLGLKQSESERVFVINDIKDAIVNSEGRQCLLIIDESHVMADGTLSSITILNNLQEDSNKLIHVILFGQETILERINRRDMEAFRQRITTVEKIEEMSPDNIRKYISHRIEAAGGNLSIISDNGWEALVLACNTGGATPGIINLLCDRALGIAYKKHKAKVDIEDVCKAADKIGIAKEIYRYMVTLKRNERLNNDTSTIKGDSPEEPEILRKEPVQSLDTGPEGIESNQWEPPDLTLEEPENETAPETMKRGFKNHFKAFLKKVIGERINEPEEKIEAARAELEEETAGEKVVPEIQESLAEENIGAAAAELEENASGEIVISDIKEDKVLEEDNPFSEWLTVGMKGTKIFELADEKKEQSKIDVVSSFAADKPVTAPLENSRELKTSDNKEEKKMEEGVDSSSEWITIDRKGVASFDCNNKDKKPGKKEKKAEDLDGWVTMDGQKSEEDIDYSPEWVGMNLKGTGSSKSDEAAENKKPGKKKADNKKTEKKKTVKKKTVSKKAVKNKKEKKKAEVKSG